MLHSNNHTSAIMGISDWKITTESDSPGGWRRYALLRSPRDRQPLRTNLTFIVLFFGAGALLGRTWNKSTSREVSDVATIQRSMDVAVASPTRTTTVATDEPFIRKQSPDGSCRIAWLMSFPNSGTSYTTNLVRTVTGQRAATNYGTSNLLDDGTSEAVFKDSPGGPFWTDPLDEKYAVPEGGYKDYLLTKTHCGGYCDQCPPEKYVENHQVFVRQCLATRHIAKDGIGELKEKIGSYSKDIVGRAVHLIRDPFDNVVSRFHLAHKHFVKKNHTEKIALYPRSKEGFRAFCKDLGKRYYEEEKATKFYLDVFEEVKNVPCRADFFRYIQWHNLAFIVAWNLRIPTMILHYENYTDSFNQTKDMLLAFLNQQDINEPPPFVTGKTYREYFTYAEIQAVSTMFSKLALHKTWDHTKHYFIH